MRDDSTRGGGEGRSFTATATAATPVAARRPAATTTIFHPANEAPVTAAETGIDPVAVADAVAPAVEAAAVDVVVTAAPTATPALIARTFARREDDARSARPALTSAMRSLCIELLIGPPGNRTRGAP